ncbi:MAG TPA: hypothetical protein DEO65_06285 [Bacillus bacterium]|nr:hypothetical protein [Bacillus sp. (in: firmicutes)]
MLEKGSCKVGQAYSCVGALLWGTLAIIVKKLSYYDFSEMEIVTIHVFGAFIFLIPFALATNSMGQFKIR